MKGLKISSKLLFLCLLVELLLTFVPNTYIPNLKHNLIGGREEKRGGKTERQTERKTYQNTQIKHDRLQIKIIHITLAKIRFTLMHLF